MVSFLLILRTDARVDQSNFTGNFPSPQPPEPLFLFYHCFFDVFWILPPGRQGTEQKIEPSGDLMIQIMQETGDPEMAYAAMVSYAELGGE